MPVMPAPTTSTSTSGATAGADGSMGCCGPPEVLYRPVSLTTRQGTPMGRGAPHGGHRSDADAAAGAPRDGAPGPRAQGAVPRPGVLRVGERAAVAPGLADGVPPRGDPTAAGL